MVSLDDAVIARFEKAGHHFEILVDPDAALAVREGERELDVDQDLASDGVFKDARKGDHVGEELVEETFETTDLATVARRILKEGEIQLTTDQRKKMVQDKHKRIVQEIARNAWNPQAKAPHPVDRIERALEEAKFHVDPFQGVQVQVKEAINLLKPLLPIAMERIQVAVRIPAEHTGHAYGQVRGVGDLKKDEWQSDGSWIGVLEIPAGMQGEVYDVLNKATKGTVETKLLK